MKKVLLVFFTILIAILSINTQFVYADSGPIIDSKACSLIDYNTGKILYEQDGDKKYPVASIVKLMTILLTMESVESGDINLDDKVIASHSAASMGGSQAFIEEGGEYSINDLLKSAIISSANDASVLLAETIAGSEDNFVVMMNKKAEEIGLTNTHYANSTGLPTINQFSSANDCAKLLKEVSKHKIYHKYSKIWIDSLEHPKGRKTELVNTNKLIRYYKGCEGGKTGSTDEAGYCLSAVASRGDMRLIGVVLGTESSKERFAQTTKLLDYGFNNFENKKVVSKGENLNQTIYVKNGKIKNLKCEYADDFYVINNKTNRSDILTKIDINTSIKAPISRGEKVGTVYIIKEGVVIGEIDIVASENIEQVTILDNIYRISKNYFV